MYKEYNDFTNRLVTTTEFCPNSNNTNITMTTFQTEMVTTSFQEVTKPNFPEIYSLSYLYYGLLATFVTVTVGLVTSAVTGFAETKDELLCLPVRILRRRFSSDYSSESSVPLKERGSDNCESVSNNDQETVNMKHKEDTCLLSQGSM